MDLSAILLKVEKNSYDSMEAFSGDVHLMCNNCVLYNGASSSYGKVRNILFLVFINV
jgi:histone acetyltransferase